MDRDITFMRLALEQADVAARAGEIPVGAVVVSGEEVVSRASNSQERSGDATAHAEILALRGATSAAGDWRLDGLELFVTLEPCPMCAGAVAASRISRLVFGAWNTKSGAAGSLYNIPEDPRLNTAVSVRRGVLADECAAHLDNFFQRLRSAAPDATARRID